MYISLKNLLRTVGCLQRKNIHYLQMMDTDTHKKGVELRHFYIP